MATAVKILDEVLTSAINNGGSVWADDVQRVMDAFGFPNSLRSWTTNTVDQIAHSLVVVDALDHDPQYAFDMYIREGDERLGGLDSAMVEWWKESFTHVADDGIKALHTYREVFNA